MYFIRNRSQTLDKNKLFVKLQKTPWKMQYPNDLVKQKLTDRRSLSQWNEKFTKKYTNHIRISFILVPTTP